LHEFEDQFSFKDDFIETREDLEMTKSNSKDKFTETGRIKRI